MSDQLIEAKKRRWSLLDMFFLATSILGLVADLISLTTFVGGAWSFGAQVSNTLKPIFLSVSILIVFYGWIGLSWTIHRAANNPEGATLLGGLFTYPLFVIWTTVAIPQTEPERGAWIFLASLTGLALYLLIGLVVSHIISELGGSRKASEAISLFEMTDVANLTGDWLKVSRDLKAHLKETEDPTSSITLESIKLHPQGFAELQFCFESRVPWYPDDIAAHHVVIVSNSEGQILDFRREVDY